MKKWIGLVALFAISAFALNKDGLQGINRTHSAQTMGHSKFGIGVLADVTMDQSIVKDQGGYQVTQYQKDPNTGTPSTTGTNGSLSNFQGSSIYTFMSIGLGSFFDFAVGLPIYYESFSSKSDGAQITGLQKTGLGDLKINTKFRAPIPQEEYVIDVAVLLGGTIATNSETGLWVRETEYMGDTEANGEYKTTAFGMTENSWRVAGLMSVDFRRLDDPVPLLFHFNVGYRAPLAKYSPVLHYSAATEIYLMDFISLFGEVYKEAPKKNPAKMVDVLEITAGGMIHTDIGLELYLALHSNVGSDSKYAGTLVGQETDERIIKFAGRTVPALYAMAGITWTGYLIPQDRDKDAVLDKFDKCPDDPEDEDNFEEDDGCPDIDNDKDGLEDLADKCPNDPEDKDNYQDTDGCPDPDNDGDGVIDVQDRCPIAAETINGIEDSDGCPEDDKDKDGVVDGRDGCPDDPEDRDSFMDMDGCPDPDNDMDGIPDTKDKCPITPETKNGIDDADGCPEGDSDGDGVLDDKDECPTQAEDRDNFEDKDGCPDEDNDADGILDSADQCPIKAAGPNGKNGCPLIDDDNDGLPNDADECPKKAEDIDGFEDADGCPDTDNDKDGILDSLDKKGDVNCADLPEDKDGFEDKDGCPDPDNDKDGILDSLDKCPTQPETANGFKDDDGCPDEKVKPIEDNVILDGVNFKTGTAELTFESKRVLDKVVEQLQAYPEVHIEIRGHTDNVGKRDANMKLSKNRAKSVVDHFASKGVDMKRMSWEGFADTQPIEDNKTAAGRGKNRRIEMYRTK